MSCDTISSITDEVAMTGHYCQQAESEIMVGISLVA